MKTISSWNKSENEYCNIIFHFYYDTELQVLIQSSSRLETHQLLYATLRLAFQHDQG